MVWRFWQCSADACKSISNHSVSVSQAAKKSLANHTSIAELIKEAIDADEFGQTLATQQTFICQGMFALNLGSIKDFQDCRIKV